MACVKAGGLEITAQYDADQNTRKIMSDTKHLSLRLDGGFVGIAPSALVRPTALSGEFLTTTFRGTMSMASALSHSRSIGFAWLPAQSSLFYGFEIPTSQYSDLVFSFVTHCSSL